MSEPEKKSPVDKPQRDEKGRIVKGTTLNPGGRPKLIREFQEWLRVEAYPKAQRALLELLVSEDEKVRIQAVKEVNDRLFGRPAMTVEDAEGTRLPIGILIMPAENAE